MSLVRLECSSCGSKSSLSTDSPDKVSVLCDDCYTVGKKIVYPEPICYYCEKDLTDLPRLYSPFMREWVCRTANCDKHPRSQGQ